MSVYTSVTDAELEQFLTRYSCGKLVSLKGIADGVSNSNFYLTTTTGEFILTLYEQINSHDLNIILSLQQYLNESGISCAKIINNKSGLLVDNLANKPAAILEKLSGTTNYTITNHLCQQIGETLANFHLSADDFEFPINNSRGSAWIADTTKLLMNHLSAQDQNILKLELNFLSQHSLMSLPAGTIHADLFPDNVLAQDDVITGIIDFDLACSEVYLFDLCVCINAWCSQPDGQLDRIRMRELLQAYGSIRPLTREENLAIPMMLRAAALRFWLSRLNDVIFPNEGEMTFNKDPEEFRNILLARRERLSGMQR